MGSQINRKKGSLLLKCFHAQIISMMFQSHWIDEKNHCVIIRVENFVDASNGGYHIDIVLISRHVEDFPHSINQYCSTLLFQIGSDLNITLLSHTKWSLLTTSHL